MSLPGKHRSKALQDPPHLPCGRVPQAVHPVLSAPCPGLGSRLTVSGRPFPPPGVVSRSTCLGSCLGAWLQTSGSQMGSESFNFAACPAFLLSYR